MKNHDTVRILLRNTAVLCVLLGFGHSGTYAQQIRPIETEEAGNSPERGRDPVDARAPENRQVTQLLDRITRQVERGEWATAVPQLQNVLDQSPTGMVRVGKGRFISVASAANELLGRMPREWRARYVKQFEAVAAKSLDEALFVGDFRAVANVAGRYQHTTAGSQAIRAIALRHADRGEYSLAWHWLQKTKADKLPETQRLQVSLIAKLSGQDMGDLPKSEPLAMVRGSLSDWPMLMGRADRRGIAAPRVPMLIESWTQPLLDSQSSEKNIRRAIRNVLDSQSGVVPAAIPVVVDGRIACRTVSGVSVFDAETGGLLWRTRREASTVSTFESLPTTNRYSRMRTTRDERIQDFIFRDGVHGLLSSDGQRLFVIEDQMMPRQSYSVSRIRNGTTSKLAQQTATNSLAAYNIQTGAIEWRIGGVDSTEVFKPTLAGHYFHGVPVAYRDELFVVTEQDNAVRLQVLDAVTGEAKWSQLLAFVDTPIERDLFRRMLTAQVTVSHGMILCPTTADWLVAIDPLTQGILWIQRHETKTAKVTSRSGRRTRSVPPLSSQWAPSAPVVAGSTVVFTPPESTRIEALDVTTGKRRWSAPKLTRSYLAGVTDKHALLVGRSQISGVALEDGRTAWNLKLPDRVFAAGRGIIAGEFLHQPISSGKVISVSVESGKISHEAASTTDRLFGNLVMHSNGLVLQTPTGLSGFALRPVENKPPNSLTQALKAAQVLLTDGEASKAVELIDQFEPEAPTEAEAEQRLRILKAALLMRVQRDPSAPATDLDRLAELGADKGVLSRLRLTRQMLAEDYSSAFRALVAMYKFGNSDAFVEEKRVRVRHDRWIGEKLIETWNHLDAEAKSSVEDLISELSMADQSRDRFTTVFSFHPTATELLKKQFDEHIQAKQFVEAEKILRTFRRLKLEPTAELAFQCATALASEGHRTDAVSMLAEYQLNDRITELPPAREEPDKRDRWQQMKWRSEYVTSSLSPGRFPEVPAYRSDMQFHRDYVCLRSASGLSGRMTFLSLKDERVLWSLPMPGTSGSRSVIPNGRSLLVVRGNRLSCVSPTERRVLWGYVLPANTIKAQRVFHKLTSIRELRQPTQFGGMWRPLAIVNEEYVCIRDQRKIQILDAATGRLRWSRDDISPAAQIVGTTEAIFVEGADEVSQASFRATDGQLLPVVIDDFNAVVGAVGRNLCLTERSGLVFSRQSIRLHDPIRKSDVWKVKLNRDSRVAVTGERELVVSSGADLQIIDMTSGEVTSISAALPADAEFQFVATTANEVFLAATNDEPAMSITEFELNGRLIAFDRPAGTKKWERQVRDGVLSVTFFQHQPGLVLKENQREASRQMLFDVVLLDRNTGRELSRTTGGGRGSSSLVTSFEPATNSIEVGIASSRRVRFVGVPAEAGDPEGQEKP